MKNSLDTAREEGSEQRAFKIALKALEKGMTVMEVSEITGLSVYQVEKLKENEGNKGQNFIAARWDSTAIWPECYVQPEKNDNKKSNYNAVFGFL